MHKALLFLLSFMSVMGHAQTFTSSLISLEEGLSQSSVLAISQGPQGFLWLGTQDGLNRYDGYGFKVFKHEPFDSTSLPDNQVQDLLTDRDGRLWVGLRLKGLSLYQPESDRFFNFQHDPEDKHSLSSDYVTCIYQDLGGDIWVGTANGFNRVVIGKQGSIHFERFYFAPGQRPESRSHYIRSLFEDSQGNFWVGTLNGLSLFNRLEQQLVPVEVFPGKRTKDEQDFRNGVNAIVEDRKGALWLATGQGLFRWDPQENVWTLFLETGEQRGEFPFISDLAMDLAGDLLVTTMGEGLFVIPFEGSYPDSGWLHYSTDPQGDAILKGNMIRTLHLDQLNPDILWLGHPTLGMEKLSRVRSHFRSDPLDAPELKDLNTHIVNHLATDRKGDLWVATPNGLLRKSTSGQSDLFQHDPNVPHSLNDNRIASLIRDQEGLIWIGTPKGLDRLLPGPSRQIRFEHIDLEDPCIRAPIGALYQDRGGLLCLGMESGITFLDPQTKTFLSCSLPLPPELQNQFGRRIYAIHRDRQNRLWVGTSIGLLLYREIEDPGKDLAHRQPEVYRHDPRDKLSIRNHNIFCITEDTKGRIWMGTFNGLLLVQDEGDKLYFQPFTEKEGLANNAVYGILEDPVTGNLWMSTNKGLSKFDPESLAFENFDSSDGLQSNEFNSQAYFRDSSGEMFFGGIHGYSRFFPGEIIGDTIPPRVWITSFTGVDNQDRSLLKRPREPLQLSYQENSFSLNFIALNYSHSRRSQYAYQLEGLDEGWIYCGDSRKVNFSRLPAGDYTFRVIGANGDGVWNRVGDAIEIHIQPPFWKTIWFYLLLVFILGSSISLFLQYRIRTKVRRVMELERVRKNAAADFHDELGHKLTVISLFGEIVKKKLKDQPDILPQLNKIIENANSLYYSMKDLLWVLDPNKDSVYDLALLLKDFGDELFDKTGIAFRTNGISESMRSHNLPMDHKRHIVLIFKEVMNNALKHSDGENAVLSATLSDEVLEITFEDDGNGFDTAQPSSGGNGLQNIRDRAKKIDAELNIQSGSAGTAIYLRCKS